MPPTIDAYNITEETAALSSPFDQVITVPTHSSGDLLIAYLYSEAGRTIDSVPSGWTLLASETADPSSKHFVYWKTATGSEPGTYTWSWDGTSARQIGMLAISGQEDPTSNAIETSTNTDTGSSGSTTSPAITPSDADSLVIRMVAEERNGTFSAPSGETLLFENTGTTTGYAISYFTHGATSTGTNVWTYTPTFHTVFPHIVLAIAPAGGGGSSIAAIANHYRRLRTR